MNIALRKLAMIEKNLIAQEEAERIQGYTTSSIDRDFKERVTKLMDQVRLI